MYKGNSGQKGEKETQKSIFICAFVNLGGEGGKAQGLSCRLSYTCTHDKNKIKKKNKRDKGDSLRKFKRRLA